jgi:hypothetical protein
VDFLSNGILLASMGAEEKNCKPKDSVRRLLTAAGGGVPDKEAYWLGFHMKRFVNHTRKFGEHLDLSTGYGRLTGL